VISGLGRATKKWKYNHFYAFLTVKGARIYLIVRFPVNDFFEVRLTILE